MKFLFVLVLLSTACLSQPIPQQANTIRVKTHLSNADAYQKLVALLSQQGWSRNHDEFRTNEWVTHYRPTTSGWGLRLITAVGQGVVSFRGESAFEEAGIKRQHVPVTNTGGAGTVNRVNFEVMNKVALGLKEAIAGSSVEYTTSVD